MQKQKRRIINRFSELVAVKGRRDGRRISNRDVARATGLSTTTVNDYANNAVTRFDAHIMLKLCSFLDCTPGELIVIEEIEEPESRLRFA